MLHFIQGLIQWRNYKCSLQVWPLLWQVHTNLNSKKSLLRLVLFYGIQFSQVEILHAHSAIVKQYTCSLSSQLTPDVLKGGEQTHVPEICWISARNVSWSCTYTHFSPTLVAFLQAATTGWGEGNSPWCTNRGHHPKDTVFLHLRSSFSSSLESPSTMRLQCPDLVQRKTPEFR